MIAPYSDSIHTQSRLHLHHNPNHGGNGCNAEMDTDGRYKLLKLSHVISCNSRSTPRTKVVNVIYQRLAFAVVHHSWRPAQSSETVNSCQQTSSCVQFL